MSSFKSLAEEIEKPFEIGRLSSDADLATISIRCPHCKQFGAFDVMDQTILTFQRSGKEGASGIEYIASIRICPNIKCRGPLFAITDGVGALCTYYKMKLANVRGSSGAKRGASRLLA